MRFPDGSYLLYEDPSFDDISWAKSEMARDEKLRTMPPPDPNVPEPEYPLTSEQRKNYSYFEKYGCWPEERKFRDDLLECGVRPEYANGMAQRRALMRIGVDPDQWAALRELPF